MRFILLLPLLLVGCADNDNNRWPTVPTQPPAAIETGYTEIIVDNMRYDIFKLPDGTRCVAAYRTDNLICDWSTAAK